MAFEVEKSVSSMVFMRVQLKGDVAVILSTVVFFTTVVLVVGVVAKSLFVLDTAAASVVCIRTAHSISRVTHYHLCLFTNIVQLSML